MQAVGMETPGALTFDIEGVQKRKPIRIKGCVYNQFAAKGTWMRANFHCHLTKGEETQWPSTALKLYRDLGYDAVGGMCHDKIVYPEPVEDIIVIPGAEVSCGGHLLGIGIKAIPNSQENGKRIESISDMIRRIKEIGGVTVLAHPFKSAYTWEEMCAFCEAGLDGIEVVNSNVRGKIADTGRADQLWHNLLREGCRLIAVGSDDAHGPHEDAGKSGWGGVPHLGFTGLLAECRTAESVLDALRRGRTYASEGPEIHSIDVSEEGKMTVACSPCVACHFRSVGGSWGGGSSFPPEGKSDTEKFLFDFATQGYRVKHYMTVVLQDKHGRRAWTSPIRVETTVEMQQ